MPNCVYIYNNMCSILYIYLWTVCATARTNDDIYFILSLYCSFSYINKNEDIYKTSDNSACLALLYFACCVAVFLFLYLVRVAVLHVFYSSFVPVILFCNYFFRFFFASFSFTLFKLAMLVQGTVARERKREKQGDWVYAQFFFIHIITF